MWGEGREGKEEERKQKTQKTTLGGTSEGVGRRDAGRRQTKDDENQKATEKKSDDKRLKQPQSAKWPPKADLEATGQRDNYWRSNLNFSELRSDDEYKERDLYSEILLGRHGLSPSNLTRLYFLHHRLPEHCPPTSSITKAFPGLGNQCMPLHSDA